MAAVGAATHEFAVANTASCGWPACAGHDTDGNELL